MYLPPIASMKKQENEFEEDILKDINSDESQEIGEKNDDLKELEESLQKKVNKKESSQSPARKRVDADFLNPITLTPHKRDLSPKFIHQFACMRAYAYGSFCNLTFNDSLN